MIDKQFFSNLIYHGIFRGALFDLILFLIKPLFTRLFMWFMQLKFLLICILYVLHFTLNIGVSYSHGIYAIVNGIPISTYDVEQRAKLLSLGRQISPKAVFPAASEQLISETIKIDEAEKQNISVSEQELNNAFLQVAQNNNISLSLLKSSLVSADLPVFILEKKLRAEIMWNKFIVSKFARDIEERRDSLNSSFPVSKKEKTKFYKFREIVFLAASSLSDKKRSFIVARARSLSKTSVLCVDLDKHIGSELAVKIEPSILLPRSDLSKSVYNLLKNLRPGEFSSLKKIGEGYSMLLYCGNEIKDTIPKDMHLRYLLSNLDQDVRKLAFSHYLSLRKSAVVEFRNKT